jgi:AraC-like DNA-binding protein
VNEKISSYFSPDLAAASALQVSDSARAWRVYHESYAFCLNDRGGADWSYRRTIARHSPGTVLLMEPGEIHEDKRVYGPVNYRLVFVDRDAVAAATAALGAGGRPDLHWRASQTGDPGLATRLRRFHRAVRDGAPLLARDTFLAELLAHAIATHGERARLARDPVTHAAVRKARHILVEHFADTLSLDELARRVGVDKYHLACTFRDQVGLPPHAFQIAVRLARARELLAQGRRGAEIATVVGFSDQAHLIRNFKRVHGVTPAEFGWSFPAPPAVRAAPLPAGQKNRRPANPVSGKARLVR